jgi:hypothetical protein
LRTRPMPGNRAGLADTASAGAEDRIQDLAQDVVLGQDREDVASA